MSPATISGFQCWFLKQTGTPSLDQDKLGQDLIHLSLYWHCSPHFPWFHKRPVLSCHGCFDFHCLRLWWSEDVSLETPQRMAHMNISGSFLEWRKPHDESLAMAIEVCKMVEKQLCFNEIHSKFRRSNEHHKGLFWVQLHQGITHWLKSIIENVVDKSIVLDTCQSTSLICRQKLMITRF